jgi:hypothetical protein
MKHLLPVASVTLVASAGFFAGRSIGSTKSPHALPGTPAASEHSAATASISTSTSAKVQDSPALTDAYELILENVEPGSAGSYYVYPAFYSAVRRLNLDELRQLHRRVMAIPNNMGLLDLVAYRLVELDPAYAKDFVRKFQLGADVKDPAGLVTAWARRTPEAAIEEAIRLGTGSSKASMLLKGAFEMLANNDPGSAVSKLGLITDEKQRETILGTCLTNWASSDPVGATKWMQAHPEAYSVGTDGNETIAMFVRSVAARDVTTALEFADTLAEPLRKQSLMSVGREWATKDPVAALKWASENGLPLTQKIASNMGTILGGAILRGPEKTAKWIESLPKGSERDGLVGYTLRFAKAGIAPQLFALISEEEQPRFVAPFMMSLNKQTSGSARQWMLTLPEGNLRNAAMDNLITVYWFKDPVAIIDTFPAGESRDVGYAAHIRRSSRESAAPDVQQLSKIADEKLRQRTACEAYIEWRQNDRAAARKWLEETPHIPPEWKAQAKQREAEILE